MAGASEVQGAGSADGSGASLDLIAQLISVVSRSDDDLHFRLKYDKKGVKVWSRSIKGDPMRMVKVEGTLPVAAYTVYDTLLDQAYRLSWDESARRSDTLYRVGTNCALEYYHAKVSVVKDRDLVTRMQWTDNADGRGGFALAQRSVAFEAAPPVAKGAVRGSIALCGYYLEPTEGEGCRLTYISHADPRGAMPKWVVNQMTRTLAPRTYFALAKAAQGYAVWKAKQDDPCFKPWLSAEQLLASCAAYEATVHGTLSDDAAPLLDVGAAVAADAQDDSEGDDGAPSPGSSSLDSAASGDGDGVNGGGDDANGGEGVVAAGSDGGGPRA